MIQLLFILDLSLCYLFRAKGIRLLFSQSLKSKR